MHRDFIDVLISIAMIGGFFTIIKLIGFAWSQKNMTQQEKDVRKLLPTLGLNSGSTDIVIKACKDKKDVLPYLQKGYSKEQLEEIILGWRNNVDVTKYSDITLSAKEMQSIRYELQDKKRN